MHKLFMAMMMTLISVTAFAYEGEDPTQPTPPGDYTSSAWMGDNQMSSHGLYLSAIFSQKNDYTAVINGKVLRQGDSIDSYKVTNISKNSVTLKSNANESFELKFNDFNFKHIHQ